MASEKEKQLYFEARDRALSRLVSETELRRTSVNGFVEGLEGGMTLSATDIVPENNFSFGFIVGLLARLEAVKGKSYGASWMKEGEKGAFANIQRKFDRADNILNLNTEDKTESLPEQYGDLAVYCIKMLTLRAQTHPEEFAEWVKNIANL